MVFKHKQRTKVYLLPHLALLDLSVSRCPSKSLYKYARDRNLRQQCGHLRVEEPGDDEMCNAVATAANHFMSLTIVPPLPVDKRLQL